jgi:hypothetical protein
MGAGKVAPVLTSAANSNIQGLQTGWRIEIKETRLTGEPFSARPLHHSAACAAGRSHSTVDRRMPNLLLWQDSGPRTAWAGRNRCEAAGERFLAEYRS